MNDMQRPRRLRAVRSDEGAETTDQTNARLAQALQRAGRGDETSFGELYDGLSGLVYGVILKVLRDPAMSEEVAQEVFVELWRLAPRYDASKGSPVAWAATVAHRRAVDRVRSEESRRRRDERELEVFDDAHDVVVETVTAQLENEEVRAALATLTVDQREALTLAYYGGHTYRSVAAMLGVPEGTIKTRIRDGLIRLRDHMEVT